MGEEVSQDTSVRYSAIENERRWLLGRLPDGIEAAERWSIEDFYLVGTRLRLRRVVHGEEVVLKLGQKRTRPGGNPSDVWHTTMYLDQVEWDRLFAQASVGLTKTRHRFGPAVVDVFTGGLAGLILAEVDAGSADEVPPAVRAAVVRDVTAEEGYTGGGLARSLAKRSAEVVVLAHSYRAGGHTQDLIDAVNEGLELVLGAVDGAVSVRRVRPVDVAAVDLTRSRIVILVTNTNFGAMPGALKEVFDRHYRGWLAEEGRPSWFLVAHGESDPTGVARQLRPIMAGLGWPEARPAFEVVTPLGDEDRARLIETVAAVVAEVLMLE